MLGFIGICLCWHREIVKFIHDERVYLGFITVDLREIIKSIHLCQVYLKLIFKDRRDMIKLKIVSLVED